MMKTIQLQIGVTVDESLFATLGELLQNAVARGNAGMVSALDGLKLTARNIQPESVERQPADQEFKQKAEVQEVAAPEASKLIDSAEVSRMIGVSYRTIWRLKDAGKLPKPVSIGRLVRWRRDEIEQWIAAGCPAVHRWRWRGKQ
jgi:excisionase family DNA binding protein